MQRLSRQCAGLAVFGALTASAAHAQFSDDFDSYAAGTQLQGINGWRGWGNTPAAAGVVDNAHATSVPNAIAIGPAGDAVNELGNPTTGCWRFSVDTFVPSGGTGNQYLILLNTYNDAGPFNWSVELNMNLATGLIVDDFDLAWPGAQVPFDAWFKFQIDIDLDNDLCATRIDLNADGILDDNGADDVLGTADDELISSGQSWSNRGSGGGAVAIGAVDLFSAGASPIFHDNVSLQPCAPSFVATSYCGPTVPNSTGGHAVMTATGAQSFEAMDLAFQVTGVPMNSFGYVLMGTATDSVIPNGSVGTLCVGGTLERAVGQQILFSGTSNSVSIAADVNMLTATGAYVSPGDTRYFQYWFRDIGPTSNLSNALRLSFQ